MPTPLDPGPPSGPSSPGSGWAGWITAGAALLALAVVVMRKPMAVTAAPVAQPAPVQGAVPPVPAAAVLPSRGSGEESMETMAARATAAVVMVETATGKGSGFFVAPDTLLTNMHVVANSSYVTIRKADGETATAYLGATAPDFDLAVLKVSGPKAATFLALGSAAELRPGQEVLAIGSPYGLQNSVTRGIVSSLRQMGQVSVIQTDAAINPGNSGGPLLDRSGAAVGINTFIISSRGGQGSGLPVASQGLNFAVAIDHAKALLEGRAPASGALASQGQDTDFRPSAAPSETERQQSQGTRALDSGLAQAAQQADQLEGQMTRFLAQGYQGRVEGSFERNWYALYEDKSLPGTVLPGSERFLAYLRTQAKAIGDQVKASEDAARQAGVYPGTRRELRHKYRLEYPGWD
jgi:S1-C subfamily serine protease